MILGRFTVNGLGIFGDPNKRPSIKLNGASSMAIRQGRIWADPGATVTDDIDGTFTVYSDDKVYPAVGGAEYVLRYSYTDSGGLTSNTITRKVYIEPLPTGNNAISFLVTAI